MLHLLKEKNSDIQIYSVEENEFHSFGRVIKNADTKEIIAAARQIENPPEGSRYVPDVEYWRHFSLASEIKNECFGTLPVQIGYCWGYNHYLNAAEWHRSSEINIAVTPLVLILGHVWDMVDGAVDSSKFKVFYLPEGTMVEVYATSLHFCPCQVSEGGFGCIVALPSGTNTPLTEKTKDQKLYRRNKWIVAHEENKTLIHKGILPGITGKNYEIKY